VDAGEERMEAFRYLHLIFLLGWKMVHCIAVGSSNRSPRDKKRGISFHCLPLKGKGLLRKWLAQIERKIAPNEALSGLF